MKAVLYGTVFTLLGVANAQGGDADSLRNYCKRLDSQTGQMQVRSQNVYGQSAEGGKVTGWFRGNKLQKGGSVFYGESGRGERVVWLRAGVPVSRLKKTLQYDKPLSGRVIKTEEERWYFAGRRVVFHFVNGKKRAITATQGQKALADAYQDIAFLQNSLKPKS